MNYAPVLVHPQGALLRLDHSVEKLEASSMEALQRERRLLFSRRQRKLQLSAIVGALLLRRCRLRTALFIVLCVRAGIEWVSQRPKMSLVKWQDAGIAGTQGVLLGMETLFMACLAAMLALVSTMTIFDAGLQLVLARLLAFQANASESAAHPGPSSSPLTSSSNFSLTTDGTNGTYGLVGHAVGSESGATPKHTLSTPRSLPGSPTQMPTQEAQEDSSHQFRERRHRLLAWRAAKLAAVHMVLTCCSAAWTTEALYVVFLAIFQRFNSLVRRSGQGAYEQGQKFREFQPVAKTTQWFGGLPRTTEELSERLNFKMNLWGLELEQFMTDNWAKYLRQRQKWMRSSSSSSSTMRNKEASSWAGRIQSRWDLTIAGLNQAWVRWQISSTKTGGKKGGKASTGQPPSGQKSAPVSSKSDVSTKTRKHDRGANTHAPSFSAKFDSWVKNLSPQSSQPPPVAD